MQSRGGVKGFGEEESQGVWDVFFLLLLGGGSFPLWLANVNCVTMYFYHIVSAVFSSSYSLF